MSPTQPHWLVRPTSIRWLWRIFLAILAATVLIQWFLPVKGHFGFDGYFGFNALYGLLSCLAMIVVAKLLGLFLKRPDDYYDR